ncbi:MAG TPA: Sir2 family NAD-dependent protein deacetylase [Bacillota bacterium]|nr:Sir2 family NAD-dependent protein deacetylase [Bacillota bacterium]
MDYREAIAQAVELIKGHSGFYALTGAGMSTESGIPDFRTPGTGIWEKIDPIATASVEVLYSNPRLFYEVGFARFASITMAEPNAGHYVLAELEKIGLLKGLVTQNIDGLHVKAGSKKVWEVHGHLRSGYCLGCKRRFPFEELVQQVELKRIPPMCHYCFNMLRPDVVLFGDPMPPLFFEAWEVLEKECDLMLVAGSSLVVYPVAELPRLAKKLIIINLQPAGYDRQADVVIHEKCGKALGDILNELSK